MDDKHFLIVGEEDDIQEKVVDFAISKFGESILDDIEVDIDYGEYEYESGYTALELRIELKFKRYQYINKVHGIKPQSLAMILEDKGLKPFYIDGKFVTRNVYEWTQGWSFQLDVKKVFGFDVDEVYREFNNYILTC